MTPSLAGYTRFEDLGLDPVALSLGFFDIKWYSLAYITGIFMGWWYMLRLIAQPGAPMARRHADDIVFYVTLGIILGGRLGYCLFYAPELFENPVRVLRLWDGGMSFHGGLIGTAFAMWLFARKHQLSLLRVADYVACCVPFGLFFGRLANFVNGELWGKPATVPWAIIFPRTGMDVPRHPSQLYEAGLEGICLGLLMAVLFWRTRWRYEPGKLTGAFLIGYALARFIVEFFREPDRQLVWLAEATGLHMGQWLTLPMFALGLYLIGTAHGRRQRIEPFAGTESVA